MTSAEFISLSEDQTFPVCVSLVRKMNKMRPSDSFKLSEETKSRFLLREVTKKKSIWKQIFSSFHFRVEASNEWSTYETELDFDTHCTLISRKDNSL